MNNFPIISIITVVKNNKLSLKKTIQSVLSQSFQDYEFIVVDGSSTDGTLDIIKQYENHISSWLSEPDKGIYDAMNKGVLMASGEWLIFLNAGDVFASHDVLNDFCKFILNIHSNILVVYGKVNILINNSIRSTSGNDWEKLKKEFLRSNTNICHQATFFKKKYFEIFGFYNSSFILAGDYEFLLRYLKNNDPIFWNNIVANITNDGISNKLINTTKLYKEFYMSRSLNGLSKFSLLFIYRFLVLFSKMILSILHLRGKYTHSEIQ